ncbi:hypothetical protein LB518_20020 [Mesorhizobium sp. BR1-1-16]|uniref:hypothetical protein n=1 Tax=Mesorhizobium sp. BR1-1-16 TaxID=2876653 RepID=UPI001CCE3CB2|nr:hypothetical protein [Mesorhizobium sp. BR1-1-16]MBZ9938597.1 hypothetical protein [Mesorhizobium sp. BR1-1-16]
MSADALYFSSMFPQPFTRQQRATHDDARDEAFFAHAALASSTNKYVFCAKLLCKALCSSGVSRGRKLSEERDGPAGASGRLVRSTRICHHQTGDARRADQFDNAGEADHAVSDGLGLRWRCMEPFQPVDPNARTKIAECRKNLGTVHCRLSREQARARHSP